MLEELAYALRSGRLDPERLLSLNDEQVLSTARSIPAWRSSAD